MILWCSTDSKIKWYYVKGSREGISIQFRFKICLITNAKQTYNF